jgi:uncharacterized membrane protein YhaH (DUF805 family)
VTASGIALELLSGPQGRARISHFLAMSLFALLVSVALAGLTKRTAQERVKYAAACFLKFLAVAIAIGWLMYPFSH